MVLKFNNVEKRLSDSLVFPAFNLHIVGTKVTAIYSSLNVRNTILQMLTKEIPVVIGEISIDNIDLSKVNLSEIGFSFLSEGLYERLTVEEHLRLYSVLYSTTESIPSILREVHLEKKRKIRVKKLSYSEQKRISFAKLLIQNPELYIFEEPDQNVDFETQRIFILIIERLRNEGKSVLILTSNLESAITIANRVFKLDENGLQEIQMASESEKEESKDRPSDEIPQEEIQPVRFEKIPTKVNEKIVLFDPPEIAYIESNDGQTFLHIKGEEFPTTFTLNELEKRLQHFGFFRCHRSYIVNLQKVREVITWTRNSYSLILDDDEKSSIPLSKSKMGELKAMLGLK
ncbi:LytTR family transcriptional regulator DNA-binding domain-containing protein [Sporosarcina sp. Marseille-Q4063]|uniref:LytTR family transcriptional regulator DNA-binding domain-containing protein n=1 Tax=Sporosarcina sp. Marseille-Q4063 TaxID=2810514 RepID=UPI0020168836|nr:LytTR family transcriptional regulator DNA-binding domain-containing protein [Sporosarcina sp. Marseille-Q4063]